MEQGIDTLGFYAFEDSDSKDGASRLALKCIANILLLESSTRQVFVQHENPVKVARKLNVDLQKQ